MSFNQGFITGIKSIENWNINSSSVTITSFIFNKNGKVSQRIQSLFGYKAVHYFSNTIKSAKSHSKIFPEEILNGTKTVRKYVDQEFIERTPMCSIEMLGSVIFDKDEPFTKEHKAYGPSIGKAFISIPYVLPGQEWQCYYRSLFENWRKEVDQTKPNFWSTFFYCPIFSVISCEKMRNHVVVTENSEVNVFLKMNLEVVEWYTNFAVKLSQPLRYHQIKNPQDNIELGVCLPIPYTSTDDDKQLANAMMMLDWIRYYSLIGFKVFVYDRDAMNSKIIYDLASKYPIVAENLVYYNFTLRGELDPTDRGLKYDNNEQLNGHLPVDEKKIQALSRLPYSRFLLQGIDKTQTLTHCRFEASSVYGIENVLVIDYDEFLYCPQAEANATAQRLQLKKVLIPLKRSGYDQVAMYQRFVANKTASVRDCLISQAKKNRSIFDCYGSYKYKIKIHYIKSFHFGHTCPLTGYHQACPMTNLPRAFDCICSSFLFKERVKKSCMFIHTSSKLQVFQNPKETYTDPVDLLAIQEQRNEISTLLDYPAYALNDP